MAIKLLRGRIWRSMVVSGNEKLLFWSLVWTRVWRRNAALQSNEDLISSHDGLRKEGFKNIPCTVGSILSVPDFQVILESTSLSDAEDGGV